MQFYARIARLLDEHIEKEAIRGLIIKDKFEKIFPPEFVATAKSRKVDRSGRMAETLDLHFKAHGPKNVPRAPSVGNSNKPQTSEANEVRKEQYDQPHKPNVPNYSKNSYKSYPKEGEKKYYPERILYAGQDYVAPRAKPGNMYGTSIANTRWYIFP